MEDKRDYNYVNFRCKIKIYFFFFKFNTERLEFPENVQP